MRIIGGVWRGRRLASLGKGDPAAHLRPTTDRVRESLFNLLVHRFEDPVTGARVLDLFAGTGALGLEALSRGARQVTFVETGRKSLSLLTENIRSLDAAARVLQRDARRLGAGTPHDLVFLDPPYGTDLGKLALKAARQGGWLAEDAFIVWEDNGPGDCPEGFTLLDTRRFGSTQIAFLRHSL